MPTNFFQTFPKVDYRFGDNEQPVRWQDLSVYIDAFDQVQEYGSFYMDYQIQNPERPDQVSMKLYNTTDYYWTFFLMNNHLREQGWPLSNTLLYAQAQRYYPNICIVTNGIFINFPTGNVRPLGVSTTLVPGQYVRFKADGLVGKILRVDYDLGMYHIACEKLPIRSNQMVSIGKAEGEAMFNGEEVEEQFINEIDGASIVRRYNQWDAPHHYEDAEGNWIYPTYSAEAPHLMDQESVTTRQSVSYYQRLEEENDIARGIKVLKPDTIEQVVDEYKKLLTQPRD
jgi:hypothetical protein